MKDMFGQELTEAQALALKRKKPPTSRAALIAARIERGLHPHNGLPVRQPAGETCGSCEHHRVKRWSGTYHKCALTPDTRGPATDIRVRWPACEKWRANTPKEET